MTEYLFYVKKIKEELILTRKDDLIYILERFGFKVIQEGNNELLLVPTKGAGVDGNTISAGDRTVNVANYDYCVVRVQFKEMYLKPTK